MNPEFKENWIKVNNLSTYYLSSGKGKPVILLHGAGANCSLTYKLSLGPLSEKHKVIAPDWPGFGKSDKPKIQYTTEYYIAFLRNFMDEINIPKAVLIGHSMGGGIALGFSLKYPKRVEKLVLVGSYGFLKRIKRQEIKSLLLKMPLVFRFYQKLVKRNRESYKRHLSKGIKVLSEKHLDDFILNSKIPHISHNYQSWLRSEVIFRKMRNNFLHRLAELSIPTLILHGDSDSMIPSSCVIEADKIIKKSKLVIYQNCGHHVPREKSKEFNKDVLEFLEKKW